LVTDPSFNEDIIQAIRFNTRVTIPAFWVSTALMAEKDVTGIAADPITVRCGGLGHNPRAIRECEGVRENVAMHVPPA